MSWPQVNLIFRRELLDQLRDRRTLFMIVVLPILLYPCIGIGLVRFTVRFTEQPRLVVLRGREHLPESPPLVIGDRFSPALFDVPAELEFLQVVDDVDAEARLMAGDVQVILVVPEDIQDRIAAGQLFEWQPIYNSADEKSRMAYLRLREVLANWERQIIRARIEAKALPPDFADPFQVEPTDVATPEQVSSGMIWGKIFPFLLVVMSLTGAFYPAVDLCAGEKERGTMETLLISPAGRSEIVIGKYLTICLFSMGTAVLNLLSMAATGWVVARQIVKGLPDQDALPMLTPPSVSSAAWMLLVLVPLAAFFSALAIALAVFARSTKEGQYYLTPLFIATMPLVLVTLAPGVELDATYSIVPVTGVALLLKALIQGQFDLAREFFVPVLLPTVIYVVLALRWAIDQFSREEVLFREAERLDLWLRVRRLFRAKEPLPTAGQAVFCYAIMLLLVWFLGGSFAAGADGADQRVALQRSLIISQLVIVATPPLMMALMVTSRPRQTLLLVRPAWGLLAIAVVLALALHPIVVEAGHLIHRHSQPLPKWVEEQVGQLLGAGQPLWWQLFLIALLPAVCEELAFRGFILSGLQRRMSAPSAIILSSFLFGFFHMNPQQLPTATALGLVLGVIATRSGSLLPGICFHFLNNGLAVLMAHFQAQARQAAAAGTDFAGGRLFELLYRQSVGTADNFDVPYQVPVLIVSAVVATAALTWLWKQQRRSATTAPSDQAPPSVRAGQGGVYTLPRFPSSFTPLARDGRDATS